MQANLFGLSLTIGLTSPVGIAKCIKINGMTDSILMAAAAALRTLFSAHQASRACPTVNEPGLDATATLSDEDKAQAGALMRVNHVGEVCAQALYTAQAAVTRDAQLRSHLLEAAREETDHLAWTQQRLDALGARPSLLNPLWFAGAFALGLAAAKVSDRVSLGFVVETENQVAQHLQSHLARLPADDLASRAVVSRMKEDEERHAASARDAGALALPAPARLMMKMAAKVMTTTAHYV